MQKTFLPANIILGRDTQGWMVTEREREREPAAQPPILFHLIILQSVFNERYNFHCFKSHSRPKIVSLHSCRTLRIHENILTLSATHLVFAHIIIQVRNFHFYLNFIYRVFNLYYKSILGSNYDK